MMRPPRHVCNFGSRDASASSLVPSTEFNHLFAGAVVVLRLFIVALVLRRGIIPLPGELINFSFPLWCTATPFTYVVTGVLVLERLIYPGLEPGISGSGGQRLIH